MIDGKWGRLGMWVAPWYDNWVFVCLFVNKTIFCWNVFYFDIWRLKGSGEWLPICQFRYVRAKGESLSLWEIQTSSFHFFQRRLHRENWPRGVNMEFLGRRWKILSVCEGSFDLQWSWNYLLPKMWFHAYMHICHLRAAAGPKTLANSTLFGPSWCLDRRRLLAARRPLVSSLSQKLVGIKNPEKP